MGRKADISNEKKSAISALLRTGNHSIREISRLQGVSPYVVVQISKKIKENSSVTSTKRASCGRKKKTTPRADRKVVSIAAANRRAPLRELHKMVHDAGVDISDRTLRRRLKDANFQCRRPVKKPRLTARMKKARLAFATEYSQVSIEYWKKVNIDIPLESLNV